MPIGHAARLGRVVAPGILDAGLGSISTFLAGLFVVRYLPAEYLSIYGLLFSAGMVVTVLVTHVAFMPVEVELLKLTPTERSAYLRCSLLRSWRWTVLNAVFVIIGGLVIPREPNIDVAWPLVLTAAAWAAFAASQAYIRRMAYLCEAPWYGVCISLIQLAVVPLGLTVGVLLGIDVLYLPFGVLAVGCIASSVVGVVGVGGQGRWARVHPCWAVMGWDSVWLALIGVAPVVAMLVGGLIVAHAIGLALYSAIEGARIAAQPLSVLVMGLSQALRTRSMVAGHEGNRHEAVRVRRVYHMVLVPTALLAVAVGGRDHQFNPMLYLVPVAYGVKGLVAAMLLGHAANGLAAPQRAELIGARGYRRAGLVEVLASMAYIVGCVAVVLVGVFAVPMALGAMAVLRVTGFAPALAPGSAIYRRRPTACAPVDGDEWTLGSRSV